MTKEKRMLIYNKFDGHCAYCGCKLEYKDMQVDHVISQREMEYRIAAGCMGKKERNAIKNLNPSCRMCNHYKRANSLETFRSMITTMHERLESVYLYRIAKKFGTIREHRWDGKFYFEREGK